jgi:hypothetical protein
LSETDIFPCPESGGFCSGCALPLARSLAPQNRRTHAAPDSSLSLKCVVLVLTDEYRRECVFGFFKYPEEVLDVNRKPVAKTGLKNRWISRDFVDSPDPRFRKIVAMFAEAGYLESEKDEFAPQP